MALEVRTNIVILDPEGKAAEFTDVTGVYSSNNTGGYGSPNIDYADVEMVRLKIANYPALTAEPVIPSGAPLGQYYEYLKISGTPQVYDNKTISIGDFFIPHVAGLTVLSGDEFIATGFYSAPILPATYLPASTTPILYLNSIQLGQFSATPQVINDNLINLNYEVYDSLQIGGTATIDATYMAYSSTVTYGGSTYRLGETFTAGAATAITGTVVKLASSVSQDFVLTYNIDKSINELVIRAKSGDCQCYDEIIEGVLKCRLLIDGLKWQAKSNTLSWLKGQDILDYCTQKINELTNSSCF